MPSLADHHSNTFALTAEDVVAHFNRSIIIDERGCWLWLGAKDYNGYARFGGELVHPKTFEMAGFKCDADKEHCHTCPNHSCINPYHIYAGTHKQNMEDAAKAGTMGRVPKITPEKIQIATEMLRAGAKQRTIAKTVGMSEVWVSEFKKGVYKHAKFS